ncbi:MAG: FprA family A-type flavoprotein [PVC group bacterium]
MKPRKITEGVSWVGAIDWDRKLFDALIPLPDGTSYNSYLIEGDEKTALIDSVDPPFSGLLLEKLAGVEKIDYLVSNHAEQDHSGSIPRVLDRYPEAKVVTNPKCQGMLIDLLRIPEEKFITVEDGGILSLGNRTLEFIYTPWVHWPETMSTFLREERILFSCDFFGSHLATSDLFASDDDRVAEAAKRYYGEIMMPFRPTIVRNLDKIKGRDIFLIAPSHGPIYNHPSFIISAYRKWVADTCENSVVLPFVTMHGSTGLMVEHLLSALLEKGITVYPFNLAVTDVGKLVIALVEAATIVIGTPTVLAGPHPLALNAAALVNALRPKARFASIIGSYGWGGKTVEQITGAIANLKIELLEPILCQGLPGSDDFRALDGLADAIAAKHRQVGAKP